MQATQSLGTRTLDTVQSVGLTTAGVGGLGILGGLGLDYLGLDIADNLLSVATGVTSIGLVTAAAAWGLKKVFS